MSDFSQQSKAGLRARLLAARRARTDRAEADAAIVELLATLAGGKRSVAAYVPFSTEPGGAALPDVLAAVCDRLLVPVVRPDLDLDWEVYDGDGAPLGVRAIADAQLVVVPALAVDRSGTRLGRGGGSYDRALARVAAGTLIVAALYPGEFVEVLPTEAHDLRVDAVVTPEGVTRL